MVLTEMSIIQTLKKCVANVTFWDQGKARKVRCTLVPNKLPQQLDIEEQTPSDHMLLVWEVDSKMWVRLDLNQVTKIESEV